jgi:hypothetical protein
VAATTAAGTVCVLDADHGALLASFGERSTDLITDSGFESAITVATFGDDEHPGLVARYTWLHNTFALRDQNELDAPDVRLLHAGSFVVGIARELGVRLFVTSGGEPVGRSIPLISGAATRAHGTDRELFLLEAGTLSPALLHISASDGTLRELGRAQVVTPPMACPARLVDTGEEILLVGTTHSNIAVWGIDGTEEGHRELPAGSSACVEAVAWLEDRDALLVLTGPEPRLDMIARHGAEPGPSVQLAGTVWHDPLPKRRIAYDPSRNRAWIALSESLVAVYIDGTTALQPSPPGTEPCAAETATFVKFAR